MKSDLSDMERFYGGPWPAWTEFYREKDLRTLIRATEKRLIKLCKEPDKNKDEIMREQVVLRASRRELEEMKNRLDLF